MKNMKKLIAMLSTFAMVMSIGVSAFAEYDTATCAAGVVTLSDSDAENAGATGASIEMEDGVSYTVIIIKEADKNNVTASNLYYINQGAADETFWAGGMGVKLADDATNLEDGDYIVRIGSSEGDFAEIEFTVTNTPVGPTYALGDVNNDSRIDIDDVTAILNDYLGVKKLTDDAAFSAADVFPIGAPDEKIDIDDVTAVLNDYLGVRKLSN